MRRWFSGLWRVLTRLLLTLVGVLVLVVALLAAVIGTETGTQFALNQASAWLEPLDIEQPERALIDGLTLKRLRWQPAEGPQLDAQDLRFRWQASCLQARWFCLDELRLGRVALSLPESDAPPPPPRTETLRLPEVTLPLGIRIQNVAIDTLALQLGEQTHLIDGLSLALEAEGQQVTLSQLKAGYQQFELSAQAQVQLHSNYPLQAQLKLLAQPLLDTHPGEVLLALSGDLAALQAELTVTKPQALSLSSTVNVLEPSLPLQAKLTWPALHWPLGEAALYHARQGQLQLKGNLNNGFAVALSSELAGKDLPPATLASQSHVTLQGAQIDQLTLKTLQGEVEVKGSLDWQAGIRADTHLRLQGIDTRAHWPEFPAQVAGELQAQFEQPLNGPWQLDAPQISLKGQWLDKPLSLKGKLSANEKNGAQIEQLTLVSGRNQAQVSGNIKERIDLHAKLNFPALDELWPTLSGALSGEILAEGQTQSPSAKINLKGQTIRFEQHRLQSLELSARIDQLFKKPSRLALSIDQAQLAGQAVESIGLSLTGTQQAHQLSLQTQAELGQVALALKGALSDDQQRYQGQLTRAKLSAMGESLTLAKTADFSANLATGAVQVQPHCWVQTPASLCINTPFNSAKAGITQIALKALNLNKAAPYLPEDLSLNGQLSAEAALNWQPEAKPQLTLKTVIDALTLELAGSGDDTAPLRFRYDKAELQARTDPKQVDLALSLRSQTLGQLQLDARVAAPQANQSSADSGLSGNISLKGIELSVAKSFLPDFDTLDGAISLDGKLSGTLSKPQLNGALILDKLALAAESLPVTITSGQIKANINGNQATLEGKLQDNKKALVLGGQANWSQLPAWQAEVTIDAQRGGFPVYIEPLVEADIDPALRILASQQGVNVRGQVRIPYARITAAELPPGAPSPSSDVVVINSDQPQSPPSSSAPLPLDVNVQILLGDDIRLSAYGFNSSLDGTLGVRLLPGKPLLLSGELGVVDGIYKSYGQNLVIDEGRIYFAGPIQSAEIDAEAYRTAGSVKAGLRLSGPLVRPLAELVSTPAMSDDNILSYIVLGRALGTEGGDTSEAALLTQAALSMGLKNSQGVAQNIAGALGIANVQLELAGSGENSQVVVSGKINDKLSVKYGVGVFKPIPEISLKYDVSKNVYINMVQSTTNAIDIFYLFEFDQLEDALP